MCIVKSLLIIYIYLLFNFGPFGPPYKWDCRRRALKDIQHILLKLCRYGGYVKILSTD